MSTGKINKTKRNEPKEQGRWINCQDFSGFANSEAEVYALASVAAMAIAREAFAHVQLEMVERAENAHKRLASLKKFRDEKV